MKLGAEGGEPSGESSARVRRRTRWLPPAIALILLAIIGIWAWRTGWFDLFGDLDRLRTLIRSLGVWGPLLIILLNVVQVVLSPVPGHALNMVSGYLFGPWLGTLYTVAGMLCGSTIILWLVRRLGRPFAERLAGRENLERFDRYLERRGVLYLFWIFLLPFLPDDAICLVAGLSPLPIYQVLILALVGRTPGLFAANLIGHTAENLSLVQWLIFGAVIIVIGGLFWRLQVPIEASLLCIARRLSRRP